jgi:hypothetical protein
MGEPHHGLAGGDHLTGLGQGLHDHAVAVGEENRIVRLVRGDLGLRFGGAELGLGRQRRRLHLVVAGGRDRAAGDKVAVARLVSRGLGGPCAGRGDGVCLCGQRKSEVRAIDPHQGLAAPHGLAGVDQALDHLARRPKPEVALDAGGDDAGKGHLGQLLLRDRGDLDGRGF